ncbi:MAG TPA: hypothetical protein VK866_10170, partial [Acidimicrobiales bacterium]|nr:hypothetical protein [Acidimicrobiales bacterium]
ERILDRSAQGDPPVAVSIGVALAAPTADRDALVAAADAALYTAKREGKGRISVAPGVVLGR